MATKPKPSKVEQYVPPKPPKKQRDLRAFFSRMEFPEGLPRFAGEAVLGFMDLVDKAHESKKFFSSGDMIQFRPTRKGVHPLLEVEPPKVVMEFLTYDKMRGIDATHSSKHNTVGITYEIGISKEKFQKHPYNWYFYWCELLAHETCHVIDEKHGFSEGEPQDDYRPLDGEDRELAYRDHPAEMYARMGEVFTGFVIKYVTLLGHDRAKGESSLTCPSWATEAELDKSLSRHTTLDKTVSDYLRGVNIAAFVTRLKQLICQCDFDELSDLGDRWGQWLKSRNRLHL